MKRKKFIHLAQPWFGKEEEKEVIAAMRSGWVTLGPRVKEFEDNFAAYVSSKFALGLSSCTAALHLSLLALGLGKGDEVITTVFTFAATVNTIIHAGAKPVLIDIDEKTFNIDPQKIEKAITKRTKAIVPVHYAGQPCEMTEIKKIAKKYHLFIIEDAAHALGAAYKSKKIGSIGDLTCFSFHPIKNISTGDGGMVTTNKKRLADFIRTHRLHGMDKESWKRFEKKGSWYYEIVGAGYKYNMTDIAAALGLQQLKKLNQFIQTRREYAQIYDQEFSQVPEIITPFVAKNRFHARNLYTVRLKTDKLKINRDQFIEELKERNIGTSVYFVPIHYYRFYQKTLGYKKGDFPGAEKIYPEIISLPMYPKMRETDVYYVARTVKRLIKENFRA